MTMLGMDLGPHAGFIIAAYAVAALTVVALVAWIGIDYRAQKRRLAKLEAQGVTRRSNRTVERLA
jgi:heme exporter protein D